MRIIIALILTMMVSSCIAQNGITLDMMEESPDPGMIIVTGDGSVWPIEGVQRYAYFNDHHFIDTFYYKTDSICISLNGDSIPDVCTFVPINSVPVGDTVYFWIFSINGGPPDTITISEGINLNAGTRITITGGTDNPTINADSCLQRLEQLTDSTFQITDCAGSPLDTILIPIPEGGGGPDTHFANANLSATANRSHNWKNYQFFLDSASYYGIRQSSVNGSALFQLDGFGTFQLTSNSTFPSLFQTYGRTDFKSTNSSIFFDVAQSLWFISDDTNYVFDPTPSLGTDDYVLTVAAPGTTSNIGVRAISDFEVTPDSLEYRVDSIAIIGSNALRIYDLIDTSGWGIDIDTDSQSLSIVDHTLSITRGNSVVLPDTVAPSQIISIDGDTITLSDGGGSVVIQHPPSSDTVKLKPFHEVWTNSDSTLTVNAGFDTLVTYNDSIRWKLLDNRIDAIALGKGARSDHYNSTALGARAFPYSQDTLVHPFNSTQVDTANEWIDGLGSFISHLNDLGYQTGDIVVIKWSLTSGEMPFIDTAQDLRVAEGIHAFTITSPSLLSPVQFGFDSVPTGAYTLQANQYLTGSTAIGHDAVVDKANQIALGDSTSQELKLGDSIRMKIDTNYTHFQLVGFDSTYNQLIPIDAAAFGFTPDADFWEIGVDASPGSITDDVYTLGQVVINKDTLVNDYYLAVHAPNGHPLSLHSDPADDDVDLAWVGDEYSWAWRLLNGDFRLQDAGHTGTPGTGQYLSAAAGWDSGTPILTLKSDGGLALGDYGAGSPHTGSNLFGLLYVDNGGDVFQISGGALADSIGFTGGDSLATAFTDGHVIMGDGTRGGTSITPDALEALMGGPFITSSSILWTDATTHIYRNGAVSIGTTNVGPLSETLYVNGTSRFNGSIEVRGGIRHYNGLYGSDGDVLTYFDNAGSPDIRYRALNGINGITVTNAGSTLNIDGAGLGALIGFDLYTNGGFRETVTDGENLDIRGNTGLGVSWSSQGIVTLSNDFQFQIYVDGSAQTDVQYNNDIGFVNGTGIDAVWVGGANNNIRFDAADASASNELQTLSWNSGTNQLTITSGNTVDLSSLAGGGSDGNGWYDGSGTIGADAVATTSGSGAEINVATGDVFYINYAAGDKEFAISSSGIFLNDGTIIGGGLADQLEVNSTGGYAWIGHEDFSVGGNGIRFTDNTVNDVTIYADGVEALDIKGTVTEIPSSYSFRNAVSGYEGITFTSSATILEVAGNQVIHNNHTTTTINNDAFIGENTSDQLAVVTTSASVQLMHENVTSDLSFIEFFEDGSVYIEATGANDDVVVVADDRFTVSATETVLPNTELKLGSGNITLGSLVNEPNGTSVIGLIDQIAPTTNLTDGVQLYANGTNAELIVRDELGNTTTLSPHNFSKIPEGPSEEMAWSYYSERDGKYINVDMLKLARLVEELTGEKLVYTNSK